MSHNLQKKKKEKEKDRKERRLYSCVSAYQSKSGRLSLAASLDCCAELFLSSLSGAIILPGRAGGPLAPGSGGCGLPGVLLAARELTRSVGLLHIVYLVLASRRSPVPGLGGVLSLAYGPRHAG